jgi:hypothetical protein
MDLLASLAAGILQANSRNLVFRDLCYRVQSVILGETIRRRLAPMESKEDGPGWDVRRDFRFCTNGPAAAMDLNSKSILKANGLCIYRIDFCISTRFTPM